MIDTSTNPSNYNFESYGTKTSGSSLPSPFSYRGYYTDSETGLFYLNARYYDPTTQQFTQEDTYWGDGTNLYGYCGGNPVMYSDPSGHIATADDGTGRWTYVSTYTSSASHTTLRQGSRGEEVETLQRLLNTNGANLVVDGNFGPITKAAVKNYQADNGLVADGIVGEYTWGSLTTTYTVHNGGGSSGGSKSSTSIITTNNTNNSSTITLSPKEAGYIYALPVQRNVEDGVTAAAFYGKGSGPSVTFYGQTWGFESSDAKTTKSTSLAIQLCDFETGFCEMNFDNGINIDINKINMDFSVNFRGGLEAYSKISMVEFGYSGISIPIPFNNKKLKITTQYDLGSVGGGFVINAQKGLKFGFHMVAGCDYTFTIE